MSSSSENETPNPESVTSDARYAINNLKLKARNGYMRKYENFIMWKEKRGANSFSEEVFMDYFKDLSKSKKPSTLWAIYSMLKTTFRAKNNIEISNYRNLRAFIKKQAIGHKSQQSLVFSARNVETFLKEAPDHNYLAVKVALIFGLTGGCRNIELANMRMDDIQRHSDQLLLVNVVASPTKAARSFIVVGEEMKIVEKYMALRPKNMPSDRFFLQYHFGKCKKQVIGKNNFLQYAKKIATYLKLPNPELYSGHCLRRTAAALQAESDPPMLHRLKLMRGPGFRESLENQRSEPSASTQSPPHIDIKVERADSEVPFDFIAVEDTAPPQPSSPPPAPRRRLRRLPLSRLLLELQHRQIKLDEDRERELHEREMEQLRLRARRVEADAECNVVLRSLAEAALAWLQRPHGNGYVAARHG